MVSRMERVLKNFMQKEMVPFINLQIANALQETSDARRLMSPNQFARGTPSSSSTSKTAVSTKRKMAVPLYSSEGDNDLNDRSPAVAFQGQWFRHESLGSEWLKAVEAVGLFSCPDSTVSPQELVDVVKQLLREALCAQESHVLCTYLPESVREKIESSRLELDAEARRIAVFIGEILPQWRGDAGRKRRTVQKPLMISAIAEDLAYSEYFYERLQNAPNETATLAVKEDAGLQKRHGRRSSLSKAGFEKLCNALSKAAGVTIPDSLAQALQGCIAAGQWRFTLTFLKCFLNFFLLCFH